MRANQRELLFEAGFAHDAHHRLVKGSQGGKRPPRPHALRDPWRMLEDGAEPGDERLPVERPVHMEGNILFPRCSPPNASCSAAIRSPGTRSSPAAWRRSSFGPKAAPATIW